MRNRLSSLILSIALTSPLLAAPGVSLADEPQVGARPYEMDWAGRTEEVNPTLVDFEDLDGWQVDGVNSVASFERSREQQMYGQYVGKLTYRKGDGKESPTVYVRPAEPIAIPDQNFDVCSCWIYGNNWFWHTDPSTPRVLVSALFLKESGEEYALDLMTVGWQEWFLCYNVITKEVKEQIGANAKFAGFRVTGGTNTEDRSLYFDSLCVFKEKLDPIDIPLRAKPGIDLFEGQPLGVNSGEGRLPFPTTEDTILPDSSKKLEKPAMHFYGDYCDFVYEGEDGTLVYEYRPSKGDWSDVAARWEDCQRIYPCSEGGVKYLIGENGAEEPVEKAELVELKQFQNGVRAIWNLASKTTSAKVEYRLQIKGKSLVVDTIAPGGNVSGVSAGRLDGIAKPRVFTIPYYLYDYGKRPGVAVFNPLDSETNLFASAHIDWYRSSASYLMGRNGADAYEKEVLVGMIGAKRLEKQTCAIAYLNGSANYYPKTDGTRNDVYERFIFTISPDFAETLPSIPNPKSPYRAVAGKGVWRAHGATTRDGDKKYWRDVWRNGMRHIIVTDHEVCWRDGGESFTFRTKPAPNKGGDAGWIDYSRFMQDTLGFVYGPYNNFTDFAPVNEYWSPDMVNRYTNGTLQHAWARCYAPKPTQAVQYCEKLTPINQEKFKFSCAYCDVHSSVPAWTRTDYDARVPGAGTFMSVFYPYGEIFLLQKKNWGGPTYSEGPHHCFYAGLTDGNYAQDQPYNMFKNQWLLDFDLLKIHEQEVDFGMGNLDMFAPGYRPKGPEEISAFYDRFLAATLAFGHSGFLAIDHGIPLAQRAYFMVQQIASRYTQCSVASIRYFNDKGEELDTSTALASNAVARSQVCVRYQDGTVVVSNGSTKETLNVNVDGREISLPPNGYTAWTSDGQILVESFLSASGSRFDYCDSPEYIYFDGRGTWTRRDKACGSGSGVCRILENDQFEIIPGGDVGFKLLGPNEKIEAVALDYDMNELGPAETKTARGFVYVTPVEGAFSYRLTKSRDDASKNWTCDRYEVVAGETVLLKNGDEEKEVQIPVDAELGNFWLELEQGAVDFQIVRPFEPIFKLDPKTKILTLEFKKNISTVDIEEQFECGSKKFRTHTTLADGVKVTQSPGLPRAEKEGEEVGKAVFKASYCDGKVQKETTYNLTFKTEERFVRFSDYAFGDTTDESDAVKMTPYVQFRGKDASRDFAGTNATFNFDSVVCGGVSKTCRFIHPPYQGGTGRTFLRYDFTVPNEPTAFRMSAGRKDGSDVGDGIKFQIAVAEFNEEGSLIPDSEKTLAEQNVVEFKWTPMEADLSAYAGHKISLLVIADCGGGPNGDWASAADMRLESSKTEFVRELVSIRSSDEK